MSNTTQSTNSSPSPAVRECMTRMNEQRELHPEWFDEYDDAMVDVVADRQAMERLLDAAPNEFLKGLMYGKLAMRQQIASLTERAF